MPAKPWQYWLIAATPVIDDLRDLAVQLGDGGEAERLNFSVPVAMASAPTTVVGYGGCTGPVGDETAAILDGMVDSGDLPPPPYLSWVKCRNEPDPARIVRSSHPATQARIDAGDTVRWDLATALADVGMVIVQSGG